ncbi:YcaO-like family protein [Dactylosporangium sp. NPDC051541]|uniref:YcaO-like family protein n=1 Tax=Dactylosporangium sp. NPDC051541 TaxID=3363977 RepID=UPI003791C019
MTDVMQFEHVPAAPAPAARTDGQRRRSPGETWEDFGRHREALGITRVANMTGLDRVGIPVYNAIRPNSRSLSVSQGKGATHDAAKVSALMESIEYWHAEHIDLPLRRDSYRRSSRLRPTIDVGILPLRGGLDNIAATFAETPAVATLHVEQPMLWVEGRELLSDTELWVPYETVTYNRVGLDYAANTFQVTSCGLASGNDVAEATLHALCEIIERDALTMWWAPQRPAYRDSMIDNGSVTDPTGRWLLGLLEAAGLDIFLWDVTSDLDVPVFQACIVERDDLPEWRSFGPCWGYGCHPDPVVALTRAITEAAQSRVTVIVSSRDDNYNRQYTSQNDPAVTASARALFAGVRPMRRFADRAPATTGSIDGNLRAVLDAIERTGTGPVACVDLTKPELGIPVVKAIVPGLEFYSLFIGYTPGPRARRAKEAGRG